MSDEPDDVADITTICGGLVLNIGTLNKRTIKMIEGIPCSDGHSVAIEYHDGLVYYSAFGVDKAGVFTYDPKTEEVKQAISLSGNLNYIHFFD